MRYHLASSGYISDISAEIKGEVCVNIVDLIINYKKQPSTIFVKVTQSMSNEPEMTNLKAQSSNLSICGYIIMRLEGYLSDISADIKGKVFVNIVDINY